VLTVLKKYKLLHSLCQEEILSDLLLVFHPPAEALELGMKLADGGTVRLALFGGSIHRLLFDARWHSIRFLYTPARDAAAELW
jgi:hypothetical protein